MNRNHAVIWERNSHGVVLKRPNKMPGSQRFKCLFRANQATDGNLDGLGRRRDFLCVHPNSIKNTFILSYICTHLKGFMKMFHTKHTLVPDWFVLMSTPVLSLLSQHLAANSIRSYGIQSSQESRNRLASRLAETREFVQVLSTSYTGPVAYYFIENERGHLVAKRL